MRAERLTLLHRSRRVEGTCAKQRAESAIRPLCHCLACERVQTDHVCMLTRATIRTCIPTRTSSSLASSEISLLRSTSAPAASRWHRLESSTSPAARCKAAIRDGSKACDGSATRRLRDCDGYEAAQALRCRRRRAQRMDLARPSVQPRSAAAASIVNPRHALRSLATAPENERKCDVET